MKVFTQNEIFRKLFKAKTFKFDFETFMKTQETGKSFPTSAFFRTFIRSF